MEYPEPKAMPFPDELSRLRYLADYWHRMHDAEFELRQKVEAELKRLSRD